MEEQLKKEWQEFVDSQVWQGEDEFTKNMGVGNVADWWIDKLNSRQISLIKMIVEMVESMPQVENCDMNNHLDRDTISSKLKEIIN